MRIVIETLSLLQLLEDGHGEETEEAAKGNGGAVGGMRRNSGDEGKKEKKYKGKMRRTKIREKRRMRAVK